MKMRLWTSIIFFLSSYTPLAVILVIKDFDFKCRHFINIFSTIIIIGISLFSLLMLFFVIKNINGGYLIKIDKVKNNSSELINYIIPYIIPYIFTIFGVNLGDLGDIISFSFLMILICFLTIRTQNLFINPILALFGYGLYDVEYNENNINKNGIFLSKLDLDSGQNYTIQKITKFMYMVTKKFELGEK
jgi:hypothetical protein